MMGIDKNSILQGRGLEYMNIYYYSWGKGNYVSECGIGYIACSRITGEEP